MGVLSGRVAIVTGGTRGLGHAIASLFVQADAQVVCASRSARPTPKSPSTDTRTNIAYASVNVADPDSVTDLITNTVATYGRVDILVANAAVNHNGKIASLSLGHWHDMLSTNLSGVLYCIRAVAPHMRENGFGRIITVSSSMATRPTLGVGGYAATKAGVEALTRIAAIELGRYGVTVNCLAPGVLDTGLGREVLANPTLASAYRQLFGVGRPGTGTEAGHAAVFLASPAASYVNGHVLEVNGGLSWA